LEQTEGPDRSLYRLVGTGAVCSSFSFFFLYDCVLYGTLTVGEDDEVDGCGLEGRMKTKGDG
jgi:hypothetical protein